MSGGAVSSPHSYSGAGKGRMGNKLFHYVDRFNIGKGRHSCLIIRSVTDWAEMAADADRQNNGTTPNNK